MTLWGCQHDNASRPMMGWQKCFQCGARRRYRRYGVKPGPWRHDVEVLIAEEIQEAETDKRKAASTAEEIG